MTARRRLLVWSIVMMGLGSQPIGAQEMRPVPRPQAHPAAIAATSTEGVVARAVATPTAPPAVGPVTGFPMPRYVSIKATRAFARRGPGRAHRIDWVFQRRGMPVRVVAEHGHWRRVVDRDGEGGWMHYSLLSGTRTAIVEAAMVDLHHRPDAAAPVRARAEAGVILRLHACRPGWCRASADGYRGWVRADGLWGLDPGETFD